VCSEIKGSVRSSNLGTSTMGAENSTPVPPPPDAEGPPLPDLSRLDQDPAQKPGKQIPYLPDELWDIIYGFEKEDRDRENRAAGIVDFAENRVGQIGKRWTLGEFCALLGSPEFQDWLVGTHLKGNVDETYRVIRALDKVYTSFERNRPELSAMYEKIFRTPPNQDPARELRDYLDAMNHLCTDPAYKSERDKAIVRKKNNHIKYRFKFD